MASIVEEILPVLEEFWGAVDGAFAKVADAFPEEVRCERGCNDCCKAVFDLSFIEAIALHRKLKVLRKEILQTILEKSANAKQEWEQLIRSGKNLGEARINCPLLGKEGECLCYEGRPVNCRTYGIPLAIKGSGHVCGTSGFEPGISYPTVDLDRIQQVLLDLSVRAGGPKPGRLRLPIAAVVLGVDEIKQFLAEAS
ncbi:MAG: YkgJ family cysteine cluster protein [Proteobacteria bacterium]|nr:YkgJ family cysteine cluster protein [Pseudomonadota bacterium]MBU1686204.1 YkgJ family cysteine cluster protein [Pseudomonadota bacterium]